MKKNWKWIIAVLAVLLTGLLVWFLINHFSEPRLSQSQMDMIEARFGPILWDRNEDGAKTFACQYVGIYGDCVAFLSYGHNGATYPVDNPPYYVDPEFFQRPVALHNSADVALYNLSEQMGRYAENLVIWNIEWLTDEQIEQLAQDIEKIGKKFG